MNTFGYRAEPERTISCTLIGINQGLFSFQRALSESLAGYPAVLARKERLKWFNPMTTVAPPLPETVSRALTDFIAAAKAAFGERLASVVLFGSAAEGRLRATSDVNLILVLTEFQQGDVEQLAPALKIARAAIRLEPMFLLASEIAAAAECFAQKFADIARRRLVLDGPDPFTNVTIPRAAEIFRLKQVLLNLVLRLRESFAVRAGREDQVAMLVADTAGPLRACAATLLELETGKVHPPKEALDLVAQASGKPEWVRALDHVSEVREQRTVAGATLTPALFAILEIAGQLRSRAESL
jgi:predicted nucleotidyltransferase